MVTMNDKQFIQSIRNKIVPFKNINGFPVGDYLIIIDGYWIYSFHSRIPLIKVPFHSIIDAYNTCLKLIEIYGDLLHILIDKRYVAEFFQLTRYTIENETIAEKLQSLDHKIQREDLEFILD